MTRDCRSSFGGPRSICNEGRPRERGKEDGKEGRREERERREQTYALNPDALAKVDGKMRTQWFSDQSWIGCQHWALQGHQGWLKRQRVRGEREWDGEGAVFVRGPTATSAKVFGLLISLFRSSYDPLVPMHSPRPDPVLQSCTFPLFPRSAHLDTRFFFPSSSWAGSIPPPSKGLQEATPLQ